MELRVCCECNEWVPVAEGDAGSAVKCVCGRRVEVPLLEEFHERPDLISATTLEARILRGRPEINGTTSTGRLDRIVPLAVEFCWAKIHRREFVVGDFDSGRVAVFVQGRPDA